MRIYLHIPAPSISVSTKKSCHSQSIYCNGGAEITVSIVTTHQGKLAKFLFVC